jgi:pimeloyl-ACP methyl ester carboxylesterase
MPDLAAAGYHVVAPYMRGYAPSSAARATLLEQPDYSEVALGDDVLALIQAFHDTCGAACGSRKAIVIGHDWGALATYTAAARDDTRIEKLVTVAIPHPSVTNPLSKDFLPGGASDHFLYLGLDPLALTWFSANDFQGVDYYYRKWSPTWSALGPNETEPAKKSFRAATATGAIGYYKSLASLQDGAELLLLNHKRTRVPTLTVYGKDDGASNVANFAKTPPAFVGCADDEGGPDGPSCQYHLVAVDGAGHFVHRENPGLFSHEVLAFLGPAK